MNQPSQETIDRLLAEGEALWTKFQSEVESTIVHGFVGADYRAVYEALRDLKGRVATFLEWGSGTGVVTGAFTA